MPVKVERERHAAGRGPGVLDPEPEIVTERPGGALEDYSGAVPVATLGVQKALVPIPCAVIYLGNVAHRSVTLRGQVLIEVYEEDGVRKELRTIPAEASGTQSYDFSRLDQLRRPITERLVGERHRTGPLAPYIGKPWLLIDHPDHLFQLEMMRAADNTKEFAVLPKPEHRAALEEHFRNRLRINQTLADQVEQTVKNV